MASRPIIRGPGEGDRIMNPGRAIRMTAEGSEFLIIKAGEADTQGAYSIFESTMQPGAVLPNPHVHEAAEEGWYVLEGALRFQLDDEEFVARAGSYILVPRGVRHTLGNGGDGLAKYLTIFSPAGDLRWRALTEMRLAAGDGPLDMDKVKIVGREVK